MDTLVLALRVALSLAVVLAALWFLQRRVSRSTRVKRAASAVTVVTRQGISPKASVVVVDVEGSRYLLGVTEQSVTLLSQGDAPAAPAALSAVPSAAPLAPATPLVAPAVQPESASAFAQALHAETGTGTAAAEVEHESLRRPRDRAARFGGARVGRPAAQPASRSRAAHAAAPADASPLAGPDLAGSNLAGSILAGSILSGATWRQAGAALRQRRAG